MRNSGAVNLGERPASAGWSKSTSRLVEEHQPADAGRSPEPATLRLRYGLNETVNWRQFAAGTQREQLWARFRELDTHVVRLLVFDKGAPDPVGNWEQFAGCMQAVVNAGSVPMITFAKFGPPYDDAGSMRAFADQCAEVVAACVRQWGGEVVRHWYWCVWHHPNSEWVSAGLTFDHYRRIYEEVAQAILRHLAPFLEGRRPLLGGPAVDGFQPFWADWIWRFVNEIDNALIGFASWHLSGDWREPGAWGAPDDEAIFRALLLARVSEYESRARAVARMLKGRGILNVCGELNAHAHHEVRISRPYNQSVFGAAYYASALIHLIRGGADLELWKSGTDDAGPYGLMDSAAAPHPTFHAKRLCARHLRPGDRVWFPETRVGRGVDVIVAHGEGGRQSAVIVHGKDAAAVYPIAELTGGQAGYSTLLKIDGGTGGRVVEERCRDTIRFAGYGVAVVTNASAEKRCQEPFSLKTVPDTFFPKPAETRLRLRYGLNEADSWWYFARGPHRQRIWQRLRELRPNIVRIFLYDKGTPDPVEEWEAFVSYVQAVLNVGAVPMITFAKFRRPYDDPRAVRWFADRCGDVVWGCIEQWGEVVRDWYWVVWNEPNSTWIGGGLCFESYRRIYEEVAQRIVRWLSPLLGGRRPLLGGPSIEGFDPFWMDWIWRFVHEIDPALFGLVNWHRYADWRDHGEKGAPRDEAAHRALLMAQAPDYEARGRDVARLLRGSDVLNVCGEWNAHSHCLPSVRARFNQSLFGAAYGASVLLQLMRAGVDAEMLWTGTDVDCGYGVMDGEGRPTPLFHAKKLCTQYIRPGDWVWFPTGEEGRADLDAVVARSDDGQHSALLVHLRPERAAYTLSELDGRLTACRRLLKIDAGTGGGVVEALCEGTVFFEGHGVAVLTNAPSGISET